MIAILLGIAIPAVVLGRSVFAVIIGVAFITLFFCKPWRQIVEDLWAQCQRPFGILILLTFVAWLPNVYLSNFPGRSFEAVFRTLLFVGIAAMFFAYLKSDQRLLKICYQAFIVSALIAIIFALTALFFIPEIYWALRLKGWFSTPLQSELKSFSAMAVLAVPVLILAVYRLRNVWTVMGVVVCIGFIALVWETYNRSAIAGCLAIALTVVVIWTVRGGNRKLAFAGIGAVGSLIVAVIVWLRLRRGHYLTEISGDDWLLPLWLVDFERQTIWTTAWEFGLESPWFGIGANAINFVPGADVAIEGASGLHVMPAHPHSWFFEVFAETGAVGLAALIVTIVFMVLKWFRDYRQYNNPGVLAAIAIMAGYWSSGLFNFSYWSAWWQLSFMISLALCFAYVDRRPQDRA